VLIVHGDDHGRGRKLIAQPGHDTAGGRRVEAFGGLVEEWVSKIPFEGVGNYGIRASLIGSARWETELE